MLINTNWKCEKCKFKHTIYCEKIEMQNNFRFCQKIFTYNYMSDI